MLSKETNEVQTMAIKMNYCSFFSDRETYKEIMDYAELFNGGEKQSAIVTMGMLTNFYIRREARAMVKSQTEITRLKGKLRSLELKFIKS